MEPDDLDWRSDLKNDLMLLAGQFTPDRYPATVETQRTFEHSLFLVESRYSEKLDEVTRGRRMEFDQQYRARLLEPLNNAEREAKHTARTHEDLWALRAGQRGDREAIERGEYRQTETYKEGIQRIADDRAKWGEQLDRASMQVNEALNERFGFDREREQTRDTRER